MVEFGIRAEHLSSSLFFYLTDLFAGGGRGIPRGLTNGPIEDWILAAGTCLGDWFLSVIMHIEGER